MDRRLVSDFGFSRISLEPSYYDDTSGVVQQYDGIYYRPPTRTPADQESGLQLGAVVTSVGGELQRLHADGLDLGPSWTRACVQSWIQFGVRVASLSETQAPPGIEWIRSPARPSVVEVGSALPVGPSQHLLVSN